MSLKLIWGLKTGVWSTFRTVDSDTYSNINPCPVYVFGIHLSAPPEAVMITNGQ